MGKDMDPLNNPVGDVEGNNPSNLLIPARQRSGWDNWTILSTTIIPERSRKGLPRPVSFSSASCHVFFLKKILTRMMPLYRLFANLCNINR